jgi:t-SNARE complex subunit (syntaxin)
LRYCSESNLKDLANLVEQQQEDIDAVETHMDESKANAMKGLEQLEKANSKSDQKSCIIS